MVAAAASPCEVRVGGVRSLLHAFFLYRGGGHSVSELSSLTDFSAPVSQDWATCPDRVCTGGWESECIWHFVFLG